MNNSKISPILRITLSYLVFASLWILFSDQVLGWFITDPASYRQFQTYKGWLFVFVTSILLFNTVLREFQLHWEHERELAAIAQMSQKIRGLINREDIVQEVLNQLLSIFHADWCAIASKNNKDNQIDLLYHQDEAFNQSQLPLDSEIFQQVWETNQPWIGQPAQLNIDFVDRFNSICIVPFTIKTEDKSALSISRTKPFNEKDLNILRTLADITSQSIHNADLLQRNERQVIRLSALRSIDQAILANQQKSSLFRIILAKLEASLNIKVSAVIALDPTNNDCKLVAIYGMHRDLFQVSLPYCEFVLQHKLIIGSPENEHFPHTTLLESMNVDYAALPLIVGDQAIGILEVFADKMTILNPEWQGDFHGLAQQIAIALHQANIMENLRETNIQLYQAYDETIKGWSQAMDLRDKETEDHTQRVTKLTMKLATMVGISKEERAHIRRGALLHDIGKMGVPDSILLKPGPLTDEEWILMRQHPVAAKEMLEPIQFLIPAIPIPYCHHEKWDGSGYPRGLKGEEIPIEARIFALVDVWDALTSDRPYRKAWSPTKARAYIIEQAGKHFDPQLTELFLRLI